MIISFPHIGSYAVIVKTMLQRLLPSHTIMQAPPTTQKTLELGTKHSPDFVCVPFKYNLGNFIEALDNGAQILIQAGGGCRYGFYAELQQQILTDLGYKFKFINLFAIKRFKALMVFKQLKSLQKDLTMVKLAKTVYLCTKMLKLLDNFDFYIRKNIGFEAEKGSFLAVRDQLLLRFDGIKTCSQLEDLQKEFKSKFESLPVVKGDDIMRVGIIGELYTLMEPFANYFLEKELAKLGIEVARFINMSYLLFQKIKSEQKMVKMAGKYLKYTIGADGADSIARAKELAEAGFDGLIHIKPFGCTPEVNAMPILMNVSRDYKIPIIYFSFDSQTSQTGIKTRLEAFYDMLKMKKEGIAF